MCCCLFKAQCHITKSPLYLGTGEEGQGLVLTLALSFGGVKAKTLPFGIAVPFTTVTHRSTSCMECSCTGNLSKHSEGDYGKFCLRQNLEI